MQITKNRCNSYLFRNSSFIYYFRRVVPKKLQPVLKRKELKVSLGTRDRFTAILASGKLSHRVQKLFVSLQEGRLPHNIDFKNVLGFCVNGEATISPSGEIKFPPMEMDAKNPEQEKALLEAYTAALMQVQKSMVQPPSQKSSPAPTQVPTPPLSAQVATLPPAQPATSSAVSQPLSTMLFSELVQKYSIRRNPNRAAIREATRLSERASFNLFLALMGDIPLSDITPLTINEFQELLMKLPRHASQKWPGISLRKLVHRNFTDDELLSNATINGHMGTIAKLFGFAVKSYWITTNYAAGRNLRDYRKKSEIREVFKPDDITNIIAQSKAIYEKKPNGNGREMYWIQLIGMFSGMRLDEICSLRCKDVYQYQEHDNPLLKEYVFTWVFDVKEYSDRHIKTESSVRIIPIHSELIKRGLIEHLEARKKQGHEFLWDLESNAKRVKTKGDIMTKRIGTFNKKIKLKKGLVFHCWRHTVADILMKSGVEEKYQNAMLGHTQTGEGYTRYGKGFALQDIIDTVETIRYPNVNLENI